jgi:hypothetical protein
MKAKAVQSALRLFYRSGWRARIFGPSGEG